MCIRDRSETVHTSVTLALVSGVAMAAVGLVFSRWALEIMGTPADVIDPVSYTHLDVYKRQGFTLRSPLKSVYNTIVAAFSDCGLFLEADFYLEKMLDISRLDPCDMTGSSNLYEGE